MPALVLPTYTLVFIAMYFRSTFIDQAPDNAKSAPTCPARPTLDLLMCAPPFRTLRLLNSVRFTPAPT